MPVIGFVTDTVASDHHGGEMIRGAIQAAGERGHGIVTVDTEGRGKHEDDLVQGLIDRGVERLPMPLHERGSVARPRRRRR